MFEIAAVNEPSVFEPLIFYCIVVLYLFFFLFSSIIIIILNEFLYLLMQ